jgi:hypothetical protein
MISAMTPPRYSVHPSEFFLNAMSRIGVSEHSTYDSLSEWCFRRAWARKGADLHSQMRGRYRV